MLKYNQIKGWSKDPGPPSGGDIPRHFFLGEKSGEMRLFIAINLTQNMKQALLDAQDTMKKAKVHGRFTPEANMHLTLAFIGEYPDPDDVLDVLEDITFQPFTITLEGTGCFGDLWWAGIKKSDAIRFW